MFFNLNPFKYLISYYFVDNNVFINSRIRLLRESFKDSTWRNAGEFLQAPFLKNFSSIDFCIQERLYSYQEGFCFIDPKMNYILYFDERGKMIHKETSESFLGISFIKKVREIQFDSDKKIILKIENNLEIFAKGVSDYVESNPSKRLELLEPISRSYSFDLDAFNNFKVECYGRGADVICNFRHDSSESLEEYEERFSGLLCKLIV